MLDVRIVPLDERHERASFTSGEPIVDDFFRTKAIERGSRYLAGTKVAVLADLDRSHDVLGFFTLLYYEYRDGELTAAVARRLGVKGLGRIPMVLLAQLGVRQAMQGQGLGKILLRSAMELALLLAHEAGAVAMITDPSAVSLIDYYRLFGFRDIGIANPMTGQPRLFLPMKTIEAAYKAR